MILQFLLLVLGPALYISGPMQRQHSPHTTASQHSSHQACPCTHGATSAGSTVKVGATGRRTTQARSSTERKADALPRNDPVDSIWQQQHTAKQRNGPKNAEERSKAREYRRAGKRTAKEGGAHPGVEPGLLLAVVVENIVTELEPPLLLLKLEASNLAPEVAHACSHSVCR